MGVKLRTKKALLAGAVVIVLAVAGVVIAIAASGQTDVRAARGDPQQSPSEARNAKIHDKYVAFVAAREANWKSHSADEQACARAAFDESNVDPLDPNSLELANDVASEDGGEFRTAYIRSAQAYNHCVDPANTGRRLVNPGFAP